MADQTNYLEGLTVNRILGVGCYGFVFKVFDSANPGRPLAHKLFLASSNPSPLQADHNPLQEFEREGRMLDMDHENVVHIHNIDVLPAGLNILGSYKQALQEEFLLEKNSSSVWLYDKFEAATKRYFSIIRLSMELCGSSLKLWLKSATSPDNVGIIDKDFDFRRKIGQDIINGLQYLHEVKSVIHRDLKPDNIFFSEEFILPVKIGDFGLCRPVQEEGSESRTAGVGSPLYRAKDVGHELDGSAKYSRRADLYSLGLILLELFQLIPESQRRTIFDRLVSDNEITLVEHNLVFPKLRDTIIGLTKRKSADRIQSIDLVKPFNN